MKIDKELIKGSTTMLVLNLLNTGDMYGYQMIKELEKRSDNTFMLKEGTLYPILHGLESKGMIQSNWEETDSARKRKYYTITKSGQKLLAEKQKEWQIYSEAVNKVIGEFVLNNHVSVFLEEVCREIKYKKIHSDISKELLGHIDEIKAEYIENGMTEAEAAQKAVKQMGNPVEIGRELHKTHQPKTEWSIVMLIGMMVFIGGGVLFSLASDSASPISVEQFLKSYSIYASLGIAVCVGCYFFDYTKLEKYSLHIFAAALSFLFLSHWFSNIGNGVPRLIIGPLSMTPASIVIPFFLISFAGLVNKWANGNIKGMLKLISLAVSAVFIYVIQPSFASAMLLGCGFLLMLTMALRSEGFKGERKEFLLVIYGSGMIGILMLILSSPYRIQRIYGFLNPGQDPAGAGYIYLVAQKMLSGARLIGRGDGLYINHQLTGRVSAGNGFALPMINSEFIFTYIVSAFGWIAGIAVILIVSFTILRMFLAAVKIRFTYGKYVASSIVTVFTLQIALNLLMNFGLFPVSGVSLPLISYGGTNFVTDMGLIGLMLGIYRRKDISQRIFIN